MDPRALTGLVAVIMGMSIVLIPVIGLTARFALKPTVEALARFFDGRGRDEAVSLLERRMALLESQMETLNASMGRLADVSEFHAALASGETTEGASEAKRVAGPTDDGEAGTSQ
jgi:hypothetical protein